MNNLPINYQKPTIDIEWMDLVPLDDSSLPKLDAAYLPSWAGNFANALSSHTETPIELAISQILAVGATATARHFEVKIKSGHTEPCNLWFLTALPSGNRKSAIQKAVTLPLIEWERKKMEEADQEIKKLTSERKNKEAKIATLRKKMASATTSNKSITLNDEIIELESSLPDIPIPPQLWTSDATPERLSQLLSDQKECMAWISSEGGVFDLLGGRYSGGIPNLDLMLKAHSADPERVDRGCRPPVILYHPRLTFGLSPQPDVLMGLDKKPVFRGRGLLARFLYLLPPSTLGYRTLEINPIPTEIQDIYTENVHAMLNCEPSKDGQLHLLTLTEEAFFEYHQFAKVIELKMRPGNELAHCTDWAGKAPGAALRIAGVLHCMKYAGESPQDYEISQATMMSALSIMSVILDHSLKAFSLMGADKVVDDAEIMWNWIEDRGLETFTIKEAFNLLKGRCQFKKAEFIHNALHELAARGYVHVESIQEMERSGKYLGLGRPPSPLVTVRPELVRK